MVALTCNSYTWEVEAKIKSQSQAHLHKKWEASLNCTMYETLSQKGQKLDQNKKANIFPSSFFLPSKENWIHFWGKSTDRIQTSGDEPQKRAVRKHLSFTTANTNTVFRPYC